MMSWPPAESIHPADHRLGLLRTAAASVAIIGAGAHGRVVASTLRAAGIRVAGFWDDDPAKLGRDVGSARVVGTPAELSTWAGPAIIAIGDNAARRRIARSLSAEWITLIHPAAWVDPGARLGSGSVILAGAIVQPDATIGAHVIVNSRAGVDHDARLGNHSHISAAHLGAGASTGEGALLGLGSVVLPGLSVGAWAIVGAGAIVTHDVPERMTVAGNPARELGPTDPLRVARAHPTPD